jgi:hypothetical protein
MKKERKELPVEGGSKAGGWGSDSKIGALMSAKP